MARKVEREVFFAVWPTAWGAMGAVAGQGGLLRVVLPHYQPRDLVELLAWEHPGARQKQGPFTDFAELTRKYFGGSGIVDFDAVRCDLPSRSAFAGKAYRACRRIAYGCTVSYSQLARTIGRPDAARAVATAMSKNPLPLVVPCHRVIHADGSPGGFSAAGGDALKRRMLDLEKRVSGRGDC